MSRIDFHSELLQQHLKQCVFCFQVHQFWPLVRIKCSPILQFFLCSMYTPICMMPNYSKHLPVCRSVCERAKAGCAPLMEQYDFQWPPHMECEHFPEYGVNGQICMTDFREETDNSREKGEGRGRNKGSRERGGNRQNNRRPPQTDTGSADVAVVTSQDDDINSQCDCRCRFSVISNQSHPLHASVITGDYVDCAMTCRAPYFSQEQMRFLEIWIKVWSLLCAVSTLLTLVTFFLDVSRFQYPERPIIFLSGCYFMISGGFILRIALGHDVIACDTQYDVTTAHYNTNGPVWCTSTFLLIYFFGMASSMWWLILSFTWFLAAGMKWGREAIASYSQCFHVIAWLVPSIKCIVVISLKYIDGDPVAGVCSIGNQDIRNLRIFVIIPLCLYLLIGTTFLAAGFVSLFRIRSAIRQQGRAKTDKLEKLMIRIGVFSVLYTVPATIVIGCYIYEQHYRILWEVSHNCQCDAMLRTPNYSVFILKYFMSLVVGITSGFWIWSGKTVQTWRNFWRKLCCCCSEPERKQVYAPPVNTFPTPPATQPKYPSPPVSNHSTYQSVKALQYSRV